LTVWTRSCSVVFVSERRDTYTRICDDWFAVNDTTNDDESRAVAAIDVLAAMARGVVPPIGDADEAVDYCQHVAMMAVNSTAVRAVLR
jgi:hypothetical protein